MKEIEYRNSKGNLHREDGPAYIEYDGTEHWFYDGKRHREDGPAITTWNGWKRWYRHGRLHRTDGPAVMEGSRLEWWIDSRALSFSQWCKETDAPDELLVLLKLKYGK